MYTSMSDGIDTECRRRALEIEPGMKKTMFGQFNQKQKPVFRSGQPRSKTCYAVASLPFSP